MGGWMGGGHVESKFPMATYNILNSDGSFPQSITQFNNMQVELQNAFHHDLVILMFVEKEKSNENKNKRANKKLNKQAITKSINNDKNKESVICLFYNCNNYSMYL